MVLEAAIGRYRLDELVRRGGSSEVWKAHDEVLGRPVALKLLYNEVGQTVDRERFAREARAAARLTHPHIVATYDVGEWDRRPYLVMEFLDGRTVVDDLTERERLPIGKVGSIGAQVADGLAYAHASGVIHRDIKPDNLVWAENGVLKLVDFGVAWLVEETGPRLTPNGMAMGTFAYLAPETAKGEHFDERSDLYSLGCVLYELLCGVPPFVGAMPAVVLAHVQSEPVPPSHLRDDVPPELEKLVLDLLAKDPNDRPADAEVVRARLLDPAGGYAVSTHGPLPGPRLPGSEPRRRPALLLATTGLAVAGIASFTWWAIPGQDGGGPVAEVEQQPIVTPSESSAGTDERTSGPGRTSEEHSQADRTDRPETTPPPGDSPAVEQRFLGVDGDEAPHGQVADGTGAEGTGTEGTGTEGTGTEGAGTEGAGTEGAGTEGTGTEGTGSTEQEGSESEDTEAGPDGEQPETGGLPDAAEDGPDVAERARDGNGNPTDNGSENGTGNTENGG